MDEFLSQGLNRVADYPPEKMVRMPTMRERLDMAVKNAEQRLVDAQRAKEIFDKNPDLEELINLMQKGNF